MLIRVLITGVNAEIGGNTSASSGRSLTLKAQRLLRNKSAHHCKIIFPPPLLHLKAAKPRGVHIILEAFEPGNFTCRHCITACAWQEERIRGRAEVGCSSERALSQKGSDNNGESMLPRERNERTTAVVEPHSTRRQRHDTQKDRSLSPVSIHRCVRTGSSHGR